MPKGRLEEQKFVLSSEMAERSEMMRR